MCRKKDSIPWHQDQPNEALTRNWAAVTEGRAGQRLRVLLPLCGASLDLAWLQRQGHTVVGVEGVRKAAEKLFRDADIEPEVLEMASGIIKFSSADASLTVFVTDFFNVSQELIGNFDAVFDRFLTKYFYTSCGYNIYRGALEALNESDREQYIGLIKNCLNKNFRYLLSGFEYDGSLKEGPPRPLPPGVVRELFAGVGAVTVLSQENDEGPRQRWKLPSLQRYTYLIQ